MFKILIVEDEKAISNLIYINLKAQGYGCVCAYDGRQAADIMEENDFDLLLLDVMLPEIDGYELLEYAKSLGMPVIFITARASLEDRIRGLRLGADDYITKPFDMEEVLARVESALRRVSFQSGANDRLEYNGLVIDLSNNVASLDGTELSLTAKEFSILELLLKFPQKVFSKANLFESIWGEDYLSEDNSLNVHISNLRNKLKAVSPDKEFIDTVWGIGFRLHKQS